MSTLAQAMIDRAEVSPLLNADGAEYAHKCIALVRNRLQAPRPGHEREHTTAERFIFSQDAPLVTNNLLTSGAFTKETMSAQLRLIHDPIWIEWPWTKGRDGPDGEPMAWSENVVRLGALVMTARFRRDPDIGIHEPGAYEIELLKRPAPHEASCIAFVLCALFRSGAATPFACSGILGFDGATPVFGMTMADGVAGPGASAGAIKGATQEALKAMFLLCIPRVAEVRDVEPSDKLKKARARRGKPPLVQFKKVDLCIGVGGVRYKNGGKPSARPESQNDGEITGSHRALHPVIGHWRTYTTFRNGQPREKPKLTYIPPHWRGSPEYGVIIHERSVHTEDEKQ